jgi:putative nucleotidyltransferase with HDIG domain
MIVDAAIARVGQLATLPEVALEVMRLADDPSATGDDLARVLSSDPTLCARVLKIVNSAFYGVRREVTSIGGAIVVLGFGAVKNIAVAASLTRMFRGTPLGHGFEPRDVWVHSIAVATAARLIATQLRTVDPNDAFLAGLIHDIGVIVELQACRDQFAQVLSVAADDSSRPFRAIEQEHIGASHEAFGEALCRSWRFPLELQQVSGHHHAPLHLPDADRRLPAIVHVADVLAGQCAIGFSRTVEDSTISAEVLAWLEVSDVHVDEWRAALPAIVAEVSPLLAA